MKAVRIHHYGGPDVLRYEEVETPAPDAGQVLVKVAAASVNQIDVAIREGAFVTPKPPPRTIGSDGAGVIVASGSEVRDVAVGQRVVFSGLGVGGDGTNAEYVTMKPVMAVPVPDELPLNEAAALGMVFPTAIYALKHRGTLKPGQTLLVQGAGGGVGSAAVQIGRHLGARVIATVGNAEQAKLVSDLGAEVTLNYHDDDIEAGVARFTGDAGLDVVLELVVSENLATDIKLVGKGGRIVCVGQGPAPEAGVPVGPALAKNASVLFMSLNNAGRPLLTEMAEQTVALAASGAVRAVIGAELPLREARRAHELLAGRHLGKIILVPEHGARVREGGGA